MKKLYIAKGYNSWTNQELLRAFNSESEADAFIEGLTDPHIHIMAYRSTIDLVNALLNGGK
jgi:hypothetical protein